eukprot:398320_1
MVGGHVKQKNMMKQQQKIVMNQQQKIVMKQQQKIVMKPAAENSDETATENSDELYCVSFVGWADQHNDIVGFEYIRKKSNSSPLPHIKNLCKQHYNVPSELKDWVLTHCANGTILEALMPHKNISSQIIHITYLEKKK